MALLTSFREALALASAQSERSREVVHIRRVGETYWVSTPTEI